MRIAFLGDIAVLSNNSLQQNESYFREVADYLNEFDYVIGNLEVAVTNRTATMTPKSMHLRTDERIIEILKQLHVSCVVLANNHTGDYGRKGLEDTIHFLQNADIPYVGVDGSKWRISHDNSKLSLSGFCCYSTNGSQYTQQYSSRGICALTKKAVQEEIDRDRKDGYFPIVSLHWGEEFSYYPNHKQLTFARQLLQQDNILLYGHHTHVMSGYEHSGNALCAYSLGNFYFDRCVSPKVRNFIVEQTPENRESYILDVTFEGNTIQDVRTTGILSDCAKMSLCDNDSTIQDICQKISAEVFPTQEYQNMRTEQITAARQAKFAKHDLKWFFSKLNYYSICSRLMTYLNKYRYNQAF